MVIVLLVPSRTSNCLSIRFPVVSRSESRGVFLVVLVTWFYLPRIFPQFLETRSMFLLCRMFTSPHPLRRWFGKQTPAAPVRRVLLPPARAANHQNMRICWGSAMSRYCLGTCLSRIIWRVHSSSLQLSVESRFGAFLDFQRVTPKDLAVMRLHSPHGGWA